MFISIEGIDGSGKTTYIENLRRNYNLYDALIVQQPNNSTREFVNSHDLTDGELAKAFLNSMLDASRNFIKPALAANRLVISDRYIDSIFAYQHNTTIEIPDELIMPDLTILLDIDPRKARHSHSDKFERRGIDYFDRVREVYLGLAKKDPDRWRILNVDFL